MRSTGQGHKKEKTIGIFTDIHETYAPYTPTPRSPYPPSLDAGHARHRQ